MAPITTSQAKMAKVKPKSSGGVPNKAMHCRVSYLYQAATYLATLQQPHSKEPSTENSNAQIDHFSKAEMQGSSDPENTFHPVSRRLTSDLRAVSLKAQLRMSPAMKHVICKNCDTLLLDGSTCKSEVENKSKGGKKPWADMLVRRCNTCGLARRYPVVVQRQKRWPQRSPQGNKKQVKTSE